MAFNSPQFLFLFLPIVLALAFGVSVVLPRARNLTLLSASFVFYASAEGRLAVILAASIVANYAIGRLLDAVKADRARKTVLFLGILANVGPLVAFKYSSFLIVNLDRALSLLHLRPIADPGFLLPLGISFFTFKALSYIVEVYRGRTPAGRNAIHVGLYISFFPQLLAGPIARFSQMEDDLTKTRVTLSTIADGVTRFCVGLSKKVLIADVIAQNVDRIFALRPTDLPCGLAWLGAMAYTLQIYYDFSGYTDMAVGLSRMFGFACPENFANPYWSTSIREFWRRWHMTLSNWLRDFIYIPLGGNRRGGVRTYINLLVVFLVCGFWHGAGWTFAVWGLYHGCAIVAERSGVLRWLTERWRLLGHGYAILVVALGWVVFRSPSTSHAARYIGAMFGASTPVRGILPSAWLMDGEFIVALLIGAVFCVPWREVTRDWGPRLTRGLSFGLRLEMNCWRPLATGIARLILLLLLVASILQIAAGTHSPFIYSRF